MRREALCPPFQLILVSLGVSDGRPELMNRALATMSFVHICALKTVTE